MPKLAGDFKKKPKFSECQEYGALVYQSVQSPVLAAEAGTGAQSECGIVEVPLIIGGQEAGAKEFPHMAEVGYGDDDIKWNCGGSVISETSVLSAAHCSEHIEDGPATVVRLGVLNHKDLSMAQSIKIAQRISHPEYSRSSK